MQLLTLFALLCLLGPTLAARRTRSATSRCLQPVSDDLRMCENSNLTRRFGYDATTNKCKEFWETKCNRNNNSFENFKTCMETCNPDSRCLKRPVPRVRTPFRETFVFNATTMNCTATRWLQPPGIKAGDNGFKHLEQCKNACQPVLIQIVSG
uniref:Putative monolaris n=1 Tax=Amblyomma parvum TaxID=251391 RepID=A0A023G0T0_AMBPA